MLCREYQSMTTVHDRDRGWGAFGPPFSLSMAYKMLPRERALPAQNEL